MEEKLLLKLREKIANLETSYRKESVFRTVRMDTANEVCLKIVDYIDAMLEEEKQTTKAAIATRLFNSENGELSFSFAPEKLVNENNEKIFKNGDDVIVSIRKIR